MALSLLFNFSYFVLSLSLISILSFAQLGMKSNSLVSTICENTRNSSLCNQVLGSAAGASTADLKGLGYISIKIAITNAKQTLPYIASLVKQATDADLKDRYQTCLENYSDSIDCLKRSKMFLDKGDIPSLRTYSSDAFDSPGECQDSFEGHPAAPTQLNDAINRQQGLVSILLKIGGVLQGE